MSTFDFSDTIDAPVSKVWEALQDPCTIISEWNQKIEKVSNTEWKQIETEELYNTMYATFDNNSVNITSKNSKFPKEKTDITISIEEAGDNATTVNVHYDVETGALFNKISLGLFGDKIAHHVEHVIMKNIKKQVK